MFEDAPNRPVLSLALTCLAALPIATTALFSSGCRAVQPAPEQLIALGFRSPEQTFRTYTSAVAIDQPDLEYRCLGDYFKRENNVDQLSYRTFRSELLDRWPFIRNLSTAEVTESRQMDEGVWLVRSRVKHLWKIVQFDVLLAQEDYYELWSGNDRVTDGFTNFGDAVAIDNVEGGVSAGVPLQEPLPPNVGSDDVSEFRVGREWKIAAFRVADGS